MRIVLILSTPWKDLRDILTANFHTALCKSLLHNIIQRPQFYLYGYMKLLQFPLLCDNPKNTWEKSYCLQVLLSISSSNFNNIL